ncbi:MAG: peptidoglycan DD-metalloendopeptidase family protein [Deltaproteobacteria bacterium]|nr:peptidoglycan DD-metalloendopeptidase family protein [Deltaproteobacteria bacterium]
MAALVAGTAGAYVPGSSLGRRASPPPESAPAPAARSPEEFDRLLRRLDAEERDLLAELDAVGPELKLVSQRMLARGRAYYRLVRAGLLPVGGGFDALVDHAARVARLRTSLGRDLAARSVIEARSAEIGRRLGALRAERAPLAAHREAIERAREAMREADERRAAFERAFGSSQPPGFAPVAIYGADTGPVDSPAARFEELRGRLSFPLAGRAEVTAVDRLGAGGPGLELRSSRDAAVRSVAPGRVAFADVHGDGDETVVIDHGEGYFSVYAELQEIEVKVGDAVQERSRLGWVKRRGARPAVLYFELRQGATPIDPASWLGL